jgi:F-type H+-transporting ATPase subunit delta
MPKGIVAIRHAQALFQLALERDEIEKWREELKTIAATLSQPELRAILESPKVHLEEKIELINRCLPEVSQLALNFIYLLVSRRRLRLMEQIVSEYERLADAHEGLAHAEVTTAIPLDEEERDKLSKRLSQLVGARITLSTRVEPEIIGGFVAQIGDRLIDGSIKGKLKSLRRSLTQAR